MRKVLFITGSRSDYDILYSVIAAVQATPRLEAGVVVTGAHLCAGFGMTVSEIEKDGFSIVARLESLSNSEEALSRPRSAALQIQGLVEVLERTRPDIVFAAMDREEAIALALAGAYLNLPIFHLGGGDATADGIDDRVRFAVSRLAHVHLTHTLLARERLIRCGEEPSRVHHVGAPGLDRIARQPRLAEALLWDHLGWDPRGAPFAVLLQHPNFGSAADASDARFAFEALERLKIPTWIGLANSDPGNQSLRQLSRAFCERSPALFRAYGNLPRALFVELLRNAAVLVGNSSCGVIEAPFLKLPVVNLGTRQRGRELAANIICVPYEYAAIVKALERAMTDRRLRDCESLYGDGRASERIARLIAETPLDSGLLRKPPPFAEITS